MVLLKNIIAISMSLYLTGCLQTENSSSTDGNAPVGSLFFGPAQEVFINRCTGCHHDYHILPENDFFDLGLAILGDSENSKIYYRIMGSDGPNGPKNMPGTAITPTELALIKTWIDLIPPP